MKNQVNDEYFEWMFDIACKNRFSENISYRKLLMFLHSREFRYSVPKDRNRAGDGENLRYRFAINVYDDDSVRSYLEKPCSVLEMTLALAIRCEVNIMDDPQIGDRTGQWFWGMITNLGLGSMHDDLFDEEYCNFVIDRFLNRKYEPNGKGGLFTVRDQDLRKMEIWKQLCLYLNSIT